MKHFYKFLALLILWASPLVTKAQFNVDGQILIRSEYRNGYNKAIANDLDPAGFIAHRARLQASYKMDRFNFYMSVQDVRTWGSTGQANVTDGLLSLHEAWGEFQLGDYWQIKLGRQELNYDNFRFLGNLDWALQARSHDFALAKYEKDNAKFHLGWGFNQNGQSLSGNLYTVPNQYRTAQLARYENKIGSTDFSLLFWNEGRQYVEQDASGNVINEDVFFRSTIGMPTLKGNIGNTTLSGFLYYQFGKDENGQDLSAFNASGQVSQLLFSNEEGRKWRATLGFEMISGNDIGAINNENNKAYSLQYGTNHLYNGYMDWFYVSNTWEYYAGLKDLFVRTRYEWGPKFWTQADFHLFSSYGQLMDTSEEITPDKNLGSELDLTFGLIINDAVSLQGGYSQFFMSDTFESTQWSTMKNTQNWAYLMFVFRPTSKAKFIGVLQ